MSSTMPMPFLMSTSVLSASMMSDSPSCSRTRPLNISSSRRVWNTSTDSWPALNTRCSNSPVAGSRDLATSFPVVPSCMSRVTRHLPFASLRPVAAPFSMVRSSKPRYDLMYFPS